MTVEEPTSSTSTQPFAVGGSNDPHVSPIRSRREITFAVPIASIVEHDEASLPSGAVRVFSPDPPYPWQFSVTQECARRLLGEGKARLMRSSKRVRGICPVFEQVELAKGFPTSKGTPRTYTMRLLPEYLWREVYYAVINSVRTHPFTPWTWDQIVDASAYLKQERRATGRRRRREIARLEVLPGGKRLCPPLAA